MWRVYIIGIIFLEIFFGMLSFVFFPADPVVTPVFIKKEKKKSFGNKTNTLLDNLMDMRSCIGIVLSREGKRTACRSVTCLGWRYASLRPASHASEAAPLIHTDL